jgi:hypothetical protein
MTAAPRLPLSLSFISLSFIYLNGVCPLAQDQEAGLALAPHGRDAGPDEDRVPRVGLTEVSDSAPHPPRLGLGRHQRRVAVPVGQGVGGGGFRFGGGFALRGGGGFGALCVESE